jgi:hypothetical protein
VDLEYSADKKYERLATVLLTIAGALALFNIIHNPFNILGLALVAMVTFVNKMSLKHRLTLFAIFVVIILGVINLIEFGHGNEYLYSNMSLAKRCFTNFVYAALILSLPLALFYIYFMELIKAMEHEKKYYGVIKYSPGLICKTHLAKTNEEMYHGFKSVCCRMDRTCLKKNRITRADEIVGLVGLEKSAAPQNGKYYLTLWDLESGKIHDADYDVVEIHENPGIEDYNGIISKIVSFYYNELERYKPLNQMVIRIVGSPEISVSTRRLLQERFLRIEYITK